MVGRITAGFTSKITHLPPSHEAASVFHSPSDWTTPSTQSIPLNLFYYHQGALSNQVLPEFKDRKTHNRSFMLESCPHYAEVRHPIATATNIKLVLDMDQFHDILLGVEFKARYIS